jgi:hypothetical protein
MKKKKVMNLCRDVSLLVISLVNNNVCGIAEFSTSTAVAPSSTGFYLK